MANLFILLTLASFFAAFLGLISPKIVFLKKFSRFKTFALFMGLTVLFFIGFGITDTKEYKKNKAITSQAETKKLTSEEAKAKPAKRLTFEEAKARAAKRAAAGKEAKLCEEAGNIPDDDFKAKFDIYSKLIKLNLKKKYLKEYNRYKTLAFEEAKAKAAEKAAAEKAAADKAAAERAAAERAAAERAAAEKAAAEKAAAERAAAEKAAAERAAAKSAVEEQTKSLVERIAADAKKIVAEEEAELYKKAKKIPDSDFKANFDVYSELTKLNPENKLYKKKLNHYKAEKEAKLYKEAKKIPANDFKANFDAYSELTKLNPENKLYKKKLNHYKAKASSWMLVIYKYERNPGIRSYETEYGICRSWQLRCTKQTTGRGEGSGWCKIGQTNGQIHPSGIYEDAKKGIRIKISNHIETTDVSIKIVSGKPSYGTDMIIEVGDEIFPKITSRERRGCEWYGDVAIEIISHLTKASKLRYDYITYNQKHIKDSQSLIGFAEAWNYAVKFTGYDPLKSYQTDGIVDGIGVGPR